MRMALAEAEKAAALGETPIGAVLVIEDEVIAAAHNMRETWQDPTAHAESIVLREASARCGRWRLPDATVYVTMEPCLMCAGALVLARIGRLVYGCRDPRAGALGLGVRCRTGRQVESCISVSRRECSRPRCRAVLHGFFEKLREKITVRLVISIIGRGGRAAEGGSLENCCGGNSTGGSNPPLSAILKELEKCKFQIVEFALYNAVNCEAKRRGGRAAEGARLESVFRET